MDSIQNNDQIPEHETVFYWVEDLSVRTLFLSVLPVLFRQWFHDRSQQRRVYCIDCSPAALWLAQRVLKLLSCRVEQFQFRLIDVHDREGNLIRLRIAYDDFFAIQKDITEHPLFRKAVNDSPEGTRLPTFFAKQAVSFSPQSFTTIWRALLFVQLVVWKRERISAEQQEHVLFLRNRVWWSAIEAYAQRYSVMVLPLRHASHPTMRSRLFWWYGSMFKRYRAVYWYCKSLFYAWIKIAPEGQLPDVGHGIRWRIGVDYYGQLNLGHPELYSDLFFWQQSSIAGSDIAVFFSLPGDPLTTTKWSDLSREGITAIAQDPRVNHCPAAPSFFYRPWKKDPTGISARSMKRYDDTIEAQWLYRQQEQYWEDRSFWYQLFSQHQVKIFLSWYKYNAAHCSQSDALRSLGGVMMIYQRGYEELPTPDSTIDVDVAFSYSKNGAALERQQGSKIRYHVVTGYMGDHRIPLVRPHSIQLRTALHKAGAKHIIAFFDENSGEDVRFHPNHEFIQKGYAYLIEKVLSEPWLGVIFKPKVSKTLRRRLGPVAQRLKQAEETGRCCVIEGGSLHSSYPPLYAACAADVAVHDRLSAAMAAVEAALAGIPTFLLDREGWPKSPLYRLGKGKVIFTNLDEFWDCMRIYFQHPDKRQGLGDWSPLLDEIDPFRDGHAAERMGSFVQWVLHGLQDGLERNRALDHAAERYAKRWGEGWIQEVR